MASLLAMGMPLYSTSVHDNAMVVCFLLLQEIAPLPSEKTKPYFDHQSDTMSAQSASVYLLAELSLHSYRRFLDPWFH